MPHDNIECFEDWGKLEDSKIQMVLREVETKELAVALKGTSNENIAAVQRNMSAKAAANLKEVMDKMGSVPIGDVERAQQNIIGVIRGLRSRGVI